MRLLSIILLLVCSACTSVQNRSPNPYTISKPLTPSVRRENPAHTTDLKDRLDGVSTTIAIINELFLRPIGLGSAGEIAYETSRFFKREIGDPLDEARRFQIRGFQGSIEINIQERLGKLDSGGLTVVLRF